MHRLFRSAGRIAALTALIVGGGTVATIPPAMADIGADMQLVCSGESGTHKVGLRIETTAPSSGTVGQPIQLGTVKIDIGVPAELAKKVRAGSPGEPSTPPVTGVTPSPTAPPALSGVAEMRVTIREPDRVQDGGWPAFALAATPSRGDGIVHLTGSGIAPPVIPHSPGGLSWLAGELDLSLVPAGTTAGKDGAETALQCAAEKDALLGTVRVGRENEAAPTSLSAPPRQPTAAQTELCEVLPARGTDPRYAINYEDPELRKIYESPPPPDGTRPTPSAPGLAFCIKGAGFINVKKAGNAVPVAIEASTRFDTESSVGNPAFGPNYEEHRGYVVNRTYPTPATVLGFGFMPTRAVAESVQVGAPGSGEGGPITGNLRFFQKLFPDLKLPGVEPSQFLASSYVRIKAVKAKVNGVPLALGDQCMTSSTAFTGKAFSGNRRTGILNYDQGQTLIVNDLNIPAFSGCGVTEDLSPILTASVSGSGNYVNVETGHWCNKLTGTECVNGTSPQPPTFTVLPAGDTTVTAHPFVLTKTPETSPVHAQFGCESADMRFNFDLRHWQSRFMLAKGDMSLEGCKVKASDGTEYPVVKTTQEGPLWLSVLEFEARTTIEITGVMLNAGVDVDDNGTADCSFQINQPIQQSLINRRLSGASGRILGVYDNGALNVIDHTLEVAPESTCNFPGFTRRNPFTRVEFNNDVGSNFVFTPAQQIILGKP